MAMALTVAPSAIAWRKATVSCSAPSQLGQVKRRSRWLRSKTSARAAAARPQRHASVGTKRLQCGRASKDVGLRVAGPRPAISGVPLVAVALVSTMPSLALALGLCSVSESVCASASACGRRSTTSLISPSARLSIAVVGACPTALSPLTETSTSPTCSSPDAAAMPTPATPASSGSECAARTQRRPVTERASQSIRPSCQWTRHSWRSRSSASQSAGPHALLRSSSSARRSRASCSSRV
mmetsp:Transcript_5373/g.11705  ORF Transcript_5373/g.11705 Transcript_5373/m.11705 type:complete len:240 (+) Transcript_5373:362-1081(+)